MATYPKTPLVSVVIPTYNRLPKLKQAIQSVQAQMFQDMEIVIINDCSSDGTKEYLDTLVADPAFTIIHNSENLRFQKTMNKGVSYAKGTYIARLDDDDIWILPDKLASQIEILEQDEKLGIIGTYYKSEKDTYSFPLTDKAIRKQMLFRCPFRHSSVVFRKDAFDQVGGFPEDVDYTEDWDLWMKIGKEYRLQNIPIVSVAVATEDNMSSQFFIKQLSLVRQLIDKHGEAYPHRVRAYLYISFVQFFFRVIPLNGTVHKLFQRIFKFVFART